MTSGMQVDPQQRPLPTQQVSDDFARGVLAALWMAHVDAAVVAVICKALGITAVQIKDAVDPVRRMLEAGRPAKVPRQPIDLGSGALHEELPFVPGILGGK